MTPAAPSPFLEIPESEWVCANDLCFAIYDSYPVSPGHVLVITRRVVPTFFECTAAEQGALMALVGEAKALLDGRLDPKPDGYNVGFNAGAAAGQTVPHVHVHVIPRYAGDMGDPRGGVRHVIPEKGNYLVDQKAPGGSRGTPSEKGASHHFRQVGENGGRHLFLTTGPDRPLWPRLAERLPGASEIDLLASFVQPSGLEVIRAGLFSAIAAGARVRLLVGDYLGITSPEALRQLLGWMDLTGEKGGWLGGSATCLPRFSARLAELENLRGAPDSFHPKAWRIADSSGGIVVVGSSNLSRSALVSGVEWNLLGETSGSGDLDRELVAAFDDLWQQATPLSADVVERYVARVVELREKGASHLLPPVSVADDQVVEAKGGWHLFQPRPWQTEALASLAAIRRDGYSKALVAVATGLGKTWLAAFDVLAVGRELGRPPRVLVIAHRAEILAQAEATLRQAMEKGASHLFPVAAGDTALTGEAGQGASQKRWLAPFSVSYVAGASCDLSGQLVIASIQKLSRPDSLAALAAAAPFDYCIVDEVHHAEAPSYRRVLARLSELSRAAPSFTLGLTATPERTDGVDVATLFDDILAYQATIGDGIAEGSLVPFRYRGLKDDVDFEQIPWRNGRFDPAVLEAALENAPRMERLWAEWEKGGCTHLTQENGGCHLFPRRTLVFCCSRRHAVFVRDWLRKRGVAAAAVFSDASGPGGPVSDPRMASLAAFHAGTLSALCVVDLFNEGVDIPLVDRVVMLRPTESKIVFLQQLGRGLRAAEGKLRLEVIDFVGNHRVFASRLVHLLSLAPAATAADATGFALLKRYLDGREPALPEGCVLDVELEAKELLARFLPVSGTRVVQAYRDLRADLGRRPTMTELLHRGYNPRVLPPEFPTWFDFIAAEGDATAAEAECLAHFHDWFVMLATTAMTKSFKMVLLRVLLDDGAFWSGMPIADSAAKAWTFLAGHPALRGELGDHDDKRSAAGAPRGWVSNWRKFPISIWMKEKNGRCWFSAEGGRFGAGFACPDSLRDAFEVLTGELVDFRLAAHARPRTAANGFEARVIQSRGKPFLKIPTAEDEPGRPIGPVPVVLPDGRIWEFRFARIACNVAGPPEGKAGDTLPNHLPELLRQWFGPDAGLPGTSFKVSFCRDGDQWAVEPLTYLARAGEYAPSAVATEPLGKRPADNRDSMPFSLLDSPPGGRKSATHVPVYDLTAAAGFWGPESVPEEIGWTEVPGVSLKPGMFVARVTGTSMEPLIPDGSWCLFRPCPAGSREGRVVLVQLGTDGAGENGGRFTVKKYHSEKTVTADGWRHTSLHLLPVNPAFEPIEIEAEQAADIVIVGEFAAIVPPG